MPSIDRVSSHYQGDSGASYVRSRQDDQSHRGFAINAKYFLPHLSSNDAVLDFGCGGGGMLKHIAPEVGSLEGLEVNPTARAVAARSGLIIHSGIEQLPRDRLYDAIISNHVFEHAPNMLEVLIALRQHLKPGGSVITKLPIDDARDRHQKGWSENDIDRHLQTWTPRLFANLLFEAGYSVDECRVITSAWSPRLFPLARLGLGRPAFWAMAVIKRRRQLFVIGRNPA